MSEDVHGEARPLHPQVELPDGVVLARALDVGTRVSDQVSDAPGALLLETMLGRYLVDGGGEKVWVLIDGRRSIGELVEAVADEVGFAADEMRPALTSFLHELSTLGLIEVLDDPSRLNPETVARVGGRP